MTVRLDSILSDCKTALIWRCYTAAARTRATTASFARRGRVAAHTSRSSKAARRRHAARRVAAAAVEHNLASVHCAGHCPAAARADEDAAQRGEDTRRGAARRPPGGALCERPAPRPAHFRAPADDACAGRHARGAHQSAPRRRAPPAPSRALRRRRRCAPAFRTCRHRRRLRRAPAPRSRLEGCRGVQASQAAGFAFYTIVLIAGYLISLQYVGSIQIPSHFGIYVLVYVLYLDPAFARMYPNDPDSHSTLQAQQRAYLQFQRDRIEQLKTNPPGESTGFFFRFLSTPNRPQTLNCHLGKIQERKQFKRQKNSRYMKRHKIKLLYTIFYPNSSKIRSVLVYSYNLTNIFLDISLIFHYTVHKSL